MLPAGVVVGLALLTRPVAVALLPALALLAWRSPNARGALARLAVAPAMFAVYPLLLWRQRGDPWAFLHAQGIWHRTSRPPGRSVASGTGSRGLGGRSTVRIGSDTHTYWPAVDGTRSDARRRDNLACLAASSSSSVALTVVAWRRFGAPYGLFAAVSLAIPLSFPSERWPLLSLPRFGLVIFPLFLALAASAGGPGAHRDRLGQLAPARRGRRPVGLWQWVA